MTSWRGTMSNQRIETTLFIPTLEFGRWTTSNHRCLFLRCNGGCNLVNPVNQEKSDNWISEFEFYNHTKINTVAFILCGKGFCFLRLAHFRFTSVRTRSRLFDTDILQHTVSDLKFSTRSVPVDISN